MYSKKDTLWSLDSIKYIISELIKDHKFDTRTPPSN